MIRIGLNPLIVGCIELPSLGKPKTADRRPRICSWRERS